MLLIGGVFTASGCSGGFSELEPWAGLELSCSVRWFAVLSNLAACLGFAVIHVFQLTKPIQFCLVILRRCMHQFDVEAGAWLPFRKKEVYARTLVLMNYWIVVVLGVVRGILLRPFT